MLKNKYLLSIKGKDVKRFLKSLHRKGINLINIVIINDELIIKVDQENYNKIKNIKTCYQITINKTYGFIYLKTIIRNNLVFIISFIIGIIYLFLLSHITFKIKIFHDDKTIRDLVYNELNTYGIKKYSFIKDYNYIQKVKQNIINNNKDIIEWIEIECVGATYNIRVEKRIKNKEQELLNQRHLIAKKSGIIKKIIAHNGEIIKKVNDYVSKGDIIISGEIHKGEDVKANVSATGEVYAEVWYKVKVKLPLYYYEKKKTGNAINTLKIKLLNKEINLFNKTYKNKVSNNKKLFSDFYNMVSINYSNDEELSILDQINTISNENDAIILARDKIIEKLDINEYIISQKKLKTTLNNSTINVEVFFKVYENISSYNYFN